MKRALVLLAACGSAPPPIAPPPLRDAVGDEDLRRMIADIATARACERIDDHFHVLRDGARHDVVTGVVWFHGCTSVEDGTNVTFEVAGSGWQWIEKTTSEAAAKFSVRQYVKFNATATIKGSIDLGYDSGAHVASLWFSPAHAPEVVLDPIGVVDVEHTGAWSTVVGGVGSVFARSPERQGAKEAKRQGTEQFVKQLSSGLTLTIDLCTGVMRSTVGHLPKGELAPPDVLEPSRTELELQPGGVLMLGPQRAQTGMSVHVESPGQIEISLACRDDAEAVARAYLVGAPLPTIAVLDGTHASGATDLTIPVTPCPVAVIARSLATSGPPLAFTVTRSSSQIGESNGGALVGCSKAPQP